MIRFTDSPYDRMMTQGPAETREAHGPPVRPPDHPCYGCPYGRDAPCIGICYKKLLKGSGKHAVSDR